MRAVLTGAAGFLGARWLKGQSHWPIWITVGASAVLSILLLIGTIEHSSSHGGGGDGARRFQRAQTVA